jgi:HK97 family phage portal protein
MGYLSALLNAEVDTSKRVLNDFWFGRSYLGVSSSGVWVGTERARTVSAVFACVKVLSEDIAKLPLFVYQKAEDKVRTKAEQNPLYEILHYQPNAWQTSFEWREMTMGHVLLRGNHYSEIVYGDGGIEQLIPRHPDRVTPVQNDDGTIDYLWYPPEGEPVAIPSWRMFHLRGYSSDGIRGDSVVAAMRETLGHTIAADEHGSRFFKNSAQTPFAIKHPGKLGEAAYKRLVAAQEESSGLANVGKHMILEENMSIEKIGLTNEDSQYLETREFQISEVARYFRMPPHKIGDLRRATFSNIEHQSIEYVVDTLMPWCARFEAAARRDLIAQKGKFWVEFELKGLLRGDQAARSNFYSSAIRTGWMNRAQARELENMDPGPPELEEYITDFNMRGGNENAGPEEPANAAPENDDEDEQARMRGIVSEVCRKLVRQEAKQLQTYRPRRKPEEWQGWLERFYAQQKARIMAALFVSEEDAARYCARRVLTEMRTPLEDVGGWEERYGDELLALAFGRKA